MKIVQYLFVLVASVLLGCDGAKQLNNKEEKKSAQEQKHSSERFPTEHFDMKNPGEYFVPKGKREWKYEVTFPLGLERATAFTYRPVIWFTSQGVLVYEVRGRYLVPEEKRGESLYIHYKIKEPAKKQGRLSYPEGYKLEIIKDDIGYFDEARVVYYAISKQQRYAAHLVIEYPVYSSMSPLSTVGSPTDRGELDRLLFFDEPPGLQMTMNKQTDSLLIDGWKLDVRGVPTVHLSRTVTLRSDVEESEVVKPYKEYMIYTKGIGLTSLEQRVRGRLSMRWELIE